MSADEVLKLANELARAEQAGSQPSEDNPRVESVVVQIVGAFNESAEDVCQFCGGDGWYVGHEDECYDSGDCHCSGVQVECECAVSRPSPSPDPEGEQR